MLYIGRKQFTNSVILGRGKKGGHWEKEEIARVGLEGDEISLNLKKHRSQTRFLPAVLV